MGSTCAVVEHEDNTPNSQALIYKEDALIYDSIYKDKVKAAFDKLEDEIDSISINKYLK